MPFCIPFFTLVYTYSSLCGIYNYHIRKTTENSLALLLSYSLDVKISSLSSYFSFCWLLIKCCSSEAEEKEHLVGRSAFCESESKQAWVWIHSIHITPSTVNCLESQYSCADVGSRDDRQIPQSSSDSKPRVKAGQGTTKRICLQ